MPTTSCVKAHHGVPTLFINDQPHTGMALALYCPRTDWMTDFSRAGVNLFTIPATPTFSSSCYYLSREAWTGPDTYDFSQLDERVRITLAADPNAWIFPRLNLGVPPWWLKENPDEICKFDNGRGQFENCEEFGHVVPSWASQKYRAAVKEGLRRLIAHVEASPYADRIIGYHLASGTTEEWMFWGSNNDVFCDYSTPARLAFKEWARAKYHTVDALRKAWNHSTLTFEVLDPPSRAGRLGSAFGLLRSPRAEAAPLDYFRFLSDLVADTLTEFARTVKELTHGTKTVGVFYGYILELSSGSRLQNGGHLAVERVLQCPDIDFVCSPSSYGFRQAGGAGTSLFMSALGSVKLHNKLWFDENDLRTSLCKNDPPPWRNDPDAIEKDFLQQDKELSNVLTNGVGQWWFDVCANSYDDPRLMGHMARWVKASHAAFECDRSSVDDVAFVLDPQSMVHLQVSGPMSYLLAVGQIPDLRRCGAVSGDYFISDLARLERQRLLIFPTSFAPTDEQRREIDNAKREGRILVFCYAPGLFRGQKIDEGAMEELTGIRLKVQGTPVKIGTTLIVGSPLTAGSEGTRCFSDWVEMYPAILPEDPDVTVLGTLEDGRASVVAKRFKNWTAVYCPSAPLSSVFLRSLARAAGAHVYLETPDVVWACRDIVAVSVREAGPRLIRLPRRASVTDAYTGEVLAKDAPEFTADFAALATRMFLLRS